jgi:hypothetical protein
MRMNMQPVTIHVTMYTICCHTCGVFFAVPSEVIESRQETGDTIQCPNGDDILVGSPEDEPEAESAKILELRRELMRAVHDREQAEARASDVKAARSRKGRGGASASDASA